MITEFSLLTNDRQHELIDLLRQTLSTAYWTGRGDKAAFKVAVRGLTDEAPPLGGRTLVFKIHEVPQAT
jgi:hypothetical protein